MSDSMWAYVQRLDADPFEGLDSIVVVICFSVVFIVVFVVKAIHRHEERMEMIKRGLDPSKIDDKK